MAKPKGTYVCGKCGADFEKPHGLDVHVARSHKRKPRGAAKASRRGGKRKGAVARDAAAKGATKRSVKKGSGKRSRRPWAPLEPCGCGRTDFKSIYQRSAHMRFCKEKNKAPIPNTPPTEAPARLPVPGATVLNGATLVERLRVKAEDHRRQAVEIDKEILAFTQKTQKFL